MAHVPRIYTQGPLGPGALIVDGDPARRLGSVMRLREGERFLVFNGDGREWEATVTGLSKQRLHATVGAVVRQEPAPSLVLELWCGLVRPGRFDWAIEKCVEAGADIIRPLLATRTSRGEGAEGGRRERWERIAIEAAEQCGRLHLAVIAPPARLEDLIAAHHGACIVADIAGAPWPKVAPLLPAEGRVAVAIGPEGGLTDEELALARGRGALITQLGPNILRTETAAVVAVALVRSRRGAPGAFAQAALT